MTPTMNASTFETAELEWRAALAVDAQRETSLFVQTLKDAAAGSQPALQRLTSNTTHHQHHRAGHATTTTNTNRTSHQAAMTAATAGTGAAAAAIAAYYLHPGGNAAGRLLVQTAERNTVKVVHTSIEYLCSQEPWLEALGAYSKGGFQAAVRCFFSGFCVKVGVELKDGFAVTLARAADWFNAKLKAIGVTSAAPTAASATSGAAFMALLYEVVCFCVTAVAKGPKAAAADACSWDHVLTSLLSVAVRGLATVIAGSGWTGALISAAVCMAVSGLISWLSSAKPSADGGGCGGGAAAGGDWRQQLQTAFELVQLRKDVDRSIAAAAKARRPGSAVHHGAGHHKGGGGGAALSSSAAAHQPSPALPAPAYWEGPHTGTAPGTGTGTAGSGGSSSSSSSWFAPDELCCPISGALMVKPVGTLYGHVYDQEWLLAWFARENTCPLTRQPLGPGQVFPWPEGQRLVQRAAVHYKLRLATPGAGAPARRQ